MNLLLLLLLKLVVRPVHLGPVDGDEVLGDCDLRLAGDIGGSLLGLLLLPLPLIVLGPLICRECLLSENGRKEKLSSQAMQT